MQNTTQSISVFALAQFNLGNESRFNQYPYVFPFWLMYNINIFTELKI